MNRVIVDIDDTLIDTGRRMHKLWNLLLDREISKERVDTMNLEQIFMKFATKEQISRVKEYQKRYWDLLLCLDEAGVESLKLHGPIPYAADILQSWSRKSEIIYLTGRTENMRFATLKEMKKFGFPTENTKLVMFKPEDYARPKGENPSGPTLIDTKSRLCSDICKDSNVVRVIDDFPGYFPIFQHLEISDRIGFLNPKKYKRQHYLDRGATRVVESWKEFQDNVPKAT
ncbi:MAG: HAD family acid phosphatase [Candidatus Bathyarchaeota archaeon]|nr:HAD family acid phosphatase [Candidatus Bathyarchaeota archaeon]